MFHWFVPSTPRTGGDGPIKTLQHRPNFTSRFNCWSSTRVPLSLCSSEGSPMWELFFLVKNFFTLCAVALLQGGASVQCENTQMNTNARSYPEMLALEKSTCHCSEDPGGGKENVLGPTEGLPGLYWGQTEYGYKLVSHWEVSDVTAPPGHHWTRSPGGQATCPLT